MLLRSSSTPVLGSLLSSFTDSPSNNIHSEACHALKHLPPTSVPHLHHKLSFQQTGSFSHSSFSRTSSPISPSVADQNKGFRRVQSDGNLKDLVYSSCNNEDSSNYADPPKRFSTRHRYMALETIPSFYVSNHEGLRVEEEDEETESDTEYGEERGELEEEMRAMAGKGDRLSLLSLGSGMILAEEVRVEDGLCRVRYADQEEVSGKELYLERGLSVDGSGDGVGGCRGGGGGSGGGDYNSMSSGGNDGDAHGHGVEEHYKRMVEENPGNPLFLRNYAQFLYQYKQDREGAEEYYSRAILADPKDGEVLSQYGKLVWELHQDEERALSYFERAVQASPEDSHVHAAYASFLWDTEEGEDGCSEQQCLPPQFHQGALATAGA